MLKITGQPFDFEALTLKTLVQADWPVIFSKQEVERRRKAPLSQGRASAEDITDPGIPISPAAPPAASPLAFPQRKVRIRIIEALRDIDPNQPEIIIETGLKQRRFPQKVKKDSGQSP